MTTKDLTFLFTDVEGSTAIVCSLGDDRFADVLADSRRLICDAVTRAGGRVLEARADESFAIFDDARDAVTAAVYAQRALASHDWPTGGEVRVRMGLHTGVAWEDDGHLVGLDVHRASRIADAAHGGQVLLSAETAALVDAPVRDVGEYSLPGLAGYEHIFQLEGPGLRSDFPCLRGAARRGLRVALADDSVLVREGIARVLVEAGMEIASQAGTAEQLLIDVEVNAPGVAVVDLRMPPDCTDEGLRAAKEIRRRFPDTGVLLLSQSLEPAYAAELRQEDGGVGYLLKDRVADLEQFADAVRRIAAGEQVFDPALEPANLTRA
jgi:class 3 adenylate cyclase